jgi:hypothetical protein
MQQSGMEGFGRVLIQKGKACASALPMEVQIINVAVQTIIVAEKP